MLYTNFTSIKITLKTDYVESTKNFCELSTTRLIPKRKKKRKKGYIKVIYKIATIKISMYSKSNYLT